MSDELMQQASDAGLSDVASEIDENASDESGALAFDVDRR
jgi:hypothetical protein